MKKDRNYSFIAQAVEATLDALGNPEVASLDIDPWDINLRTAELIPGIEYEQTTHNDYIISRAEVLYDEETTIKLSHVSRGKVVPA